MTQARKKVTRDRAMMGGKFRCARGAHGGRRRSRLASLCAATAFALAAMIGGAAIAAPLEKISIRLDWTPWGDQAAFHLAQAKGWFRDAGLDVDIQDGNGSVTTVQIVGNGQFDVGYAALSAMIVAREKGLPVRAIATYARKSDIGLMVPVDSNINSPKDLAGKKIGYTAGSLESPFVDLFLAAGGLTRDQVQLTNLDGSAKIGTYLAGRLDGAFSSIPFFLPPVAETRKSKGLLLADYGLQFPSFGLFATESKIAERQAALTRFVSVVSGAWAYIIKGHEDEAVQAMIADRPQAKINPTVLRGQIVAFETFFATPASQGKPVGYQAAADWDQAMATLLKVHQVKAEDKATDFYTNELFDAAIYKRVSGD